MTTPAELPKFGDKGKVAVFDFPPLRVDGKLLTWEEQVEYERQQQAAQ